MLPVYLFSAFTNVSGVGAPRLDAMVAPWNARIDAPAPRFVDGEAWRHLPDPMETELALMRYGVDPASATLFTVQSYTAPDSSLHTRILRAGLTDRRVREIADRRARSVCIDTGENPWSGPGIVHTYPTLGSTSGFASVVTVEGNAAVGTLVPVGAGDTVVVHELRLNGRLLRETMTVRRPHATLVLYRLPRRQGICYGPGALDAAGG